MAATDPTGYLSIPPDLIRGVAWKQPCRVATTASITISTALNAGDTIDGVTLAAGDRVLVKDQSTGSQNGIYVAGATPTRAFDMDQDLSTAVPAEEIAGAFVYVVAGTANAGKVFHTTNTLGGTIGSTTITWTEFTTGSAYTLTIKDEGSSLTTGATSIDFVGDGVVASGTTAAKTVTISGAPTGAAGGDLSGTYPNPSVVDDSHNHTAATVSGISGGEILVSDTPAGSPLVFSDLLQNEAGTDLLYAG